MPLVSGRARPFRLIELLFMLSIAGAASAQPSSSAPVADSTHSS